MNDKSVDTPVDRPATGKKAREKRLAAALRANLKRRKAAVQRPKAGAAAPVKPPFNSDKND